MPRGVLFEHGPIAHGERPGNLVRFFECKDVFFHGVTIQFTDITLRTRLLTGHWWGKGEPVHLSAILWAPGVEKPGRIRNVTFARLRIEGEHGIVVWGTPESPIEDVTTTRARPGANGRNRRRRGRPPRSPSRTIR